MDIPAALSGLSTALSILRQLNEIGAKVDEASFKLTIANITSALAEAKTGLVDAQEELRKRDAEIAKLKELVAFRSAKLIDRGQFRFFADEEGNPQGAPLCPTCERKGDYLKLVQDRSKGIGKITYFCPGCKANYGPHVPRG